MTETKEITNSDDIIDSRDVIARIEHLQGLGADADEFEKDELVSLISLAEQAEGYAPDWKYGACLIRHSYFTDYCEEMLKDIGDLPKDIPGYLVIDWEATAENLKIDYTIIDFAGETYYVR